VTSSLVATESRSPWCLELVVAQHSFDIYQSRRMEAAIDIAHAFGAFAAGP